MESIISEFFETSDFAQSASYTPSGGSAATIYVIFDNEFSLSNIGIGFENSAPQVMAKTSDVSAATNGATIVIDSVTYYVIGVEPDGTGVTRLILSKNTN